MICPNCGKEEPDNYVICSDCNEFLLSGVETETPKPRSASPAAQKKPRQTTQKSKSTSTSKTSKPRTAPKNPQAPQPAPPRKDLPQAPEQPSSMQPPEIINQKEMPKTPVKTIIAASFLWLFCIIAVSTAYSRLSSAMPTSLGNIFWILVWGIPALTLTLKARATMNMRKRMRYNNINR